MPATTASTAQALVGQKVRLTTTLGYVAEGELFHAGRTFCTVGYHGDFAYRAVESILEVTTEPK